MHLGPRGRAQHGIGLREARTRASVRAMSPLGSRCAYCISGDMIPDSKEREVSCPHACQRDLGPTPRKLRRPRDKHRKRKSRSVASSSTSPGRSEGESRELSALQDIERDVAAEPEPGRYDIERD